MKRNNVQTVTLPVLVSVEPHEKLNPAQDGWKTFMRGAEADALLFVHEVTRQDAIQWAKTVLTPKEWALFRGLGKLRWAYGQDDEFTLMQAYEMLEPHLEAWVSPDEWTKDLSPTKDGGSKITISSGGGQKWNATRFNYSILMTEMFRNARPVMWHSERHENFLPALYCSDKVSAVFTMQFAGQIRVCPKCDGLFIPRAGNVEYCSPEHREAHRVARSRWRAKQKLGARKESG